MALKLLTVGVVLACGSLLVPLTSAYSSGAPQGACDHMTPNHGSNAPQNTPAPYQITPGGTSVAPGSSIEVTLSSVSPSGSFMGFFIQARSAADDSELQGSFVTSEFNKISCGAGVDNAVTHSGKTSKVSAIVRWSPPVQGFSGDVVFRATVVQDFNTFWTGITSEKVTVTGSSSSAGAVTVAPTEAPTKAPTAAPSPKATTRRGLLGNFRPQRPTSAAPARRPPQQRPKETGPTKVDLETLDSASRRLVTAMDSIYLGCGVYKGCFGYPSGCEEKTDCTALFTYSLVDQSSFDFEIMGKITGANGYVAGGLSFDENMGDDSVVACRTYEGAVDVTMTWNEGKNNVFLVDQKEGLSNYEMKQIDGNVYCRYRRVSSMDIRGKTFDLANDEFNVMVARGPLSADGTLSYHSSDRLVSASATSMSAFDALAASDSLFVVLHAALMIGAWVGAASSGMLLARYFKQTWRNYKTCGIDQWFHFHRLFMIMTWGMTIAAFVLVVLQLEGWTKIPASHNPHAYIGIVSIALCFVQPFVALCRCKPSDSRRPVFNWVHWFIGNAAQCLAITAIFYGLELKGVPRWSWWLMIVFVGFHVLIHILLSFGECYSDNKIKNSVIPSKEYGGSKDLLHDDGTLMDAPGATFRKAMLALYLVVVWLITAALVAIVVIDEEQLKDWGLIFWE